MNLEDKKIPVGSVVIWMGVRTPMLEAVYLGGDFWIDGHGAVFTMPHLHEAVLSALKRNVARIL